MHAMSDNSDSEDGSEYSTEEQDENLTSSEFTEQEIDLIYRMHRLVGDRWSLIAGRIPGRTAEEIEKYWKSTNGD